jgi:hypothetical protein
LNRAKLTLGDDVKKPPRTSASPKTPKIDLRSYSRTQLMENLRSLAMQNTLLLPLADVDTSTADGQGTTKGKKKKAMLTRRVAKLVLKLYKSKQKADAASDEDEDAIVADDDDPIAMALAVRSAGTELMYVPHWGFESVVLPDAKTLRQLVSVRRRCCRRRREMAEYDERYQGNGDTATAEGGGYAQAEHPAAARRQQARRVLRPRRRPLVPAPD